LLRERGSVILMSSNVVPSQPQRNKRASAQSKKIPVKSSTKGKNLSVWFREEEKVEVEAYAERALEKPGPLARRVVLLYVRGELVPRKS